MNLSRRLESSLNRSVLRLRPLTRNGFIHWYGHDACTLRVLGLVVAIVASLLGGCQEMAQPQTGSIQLKGSETLRPLLIMCAEDFMTRQPHINVIVQGGGSGTGISALLHGTVDIGMASRELADKESDYANRHGLKVQSFDIALDGIAVVVHPENPVDVLNLEQLREIVSGRSQNWQDVGGLPHAIAVLSRMDDSGTSQLFHQRVLGDMDYRGMVQQMPTNESIVAEVASRSWAIGYTSFEAVRASRRPVKTVALQTSPQELPVPPTPETIRARSYPLARMLHL
jgi:phosphate transport system substrate-binding protein